MRRLLLPAILTLLVLISLMILPSPSAQTIGWEKYFYGNGVDSGYGVAADSDYVVVVGKYLNSTGYAKAFVAKLSKADGSLLWIKALKIHDNDEAYDVTVDGQGNIYVVGQTQDGIAPPHYYGFAAKFDPYGNLQWSRIWDETTNSTGRGVAVDSNGYVYVTGEIDIGTSYDCLIMKLSPTDGSLVWSKRIGTADRHEYGYDIAIDGNDNIYVAGKNASAYSAFLLKLDTGGNMIWGEIWKIGLHNTWSESVTVDPSGNVYIAGPVRYTYNASIAKFDENGNLQWAKTWDGGGTDEAHSVAADSQRVYLAGYTVDPNTGDHAVLVVAFDHVGNLAWDVVWNGTEFEEAYAVASGSLYITGLTRSLSLTLTDISGTITDVTDQPVKILGTPVAISISLASLGEEYTPTPEEGRSAAQDYDIFVLALATPSPAPVGGEIITPYSQGSWEQITSIMAVISLISILILTVIIRKHYTRR